MTYEAHVNVICSMLWQRGERQGNCLRTVSRKQVENVVTKYNEREGVIMTVREILTASTRRWSIDSTMQSDRFLILMKGD
jgi:hypothetical protein